MAHNFSLFENFVFFYLLLIFLLLFFSIGCFAAVFLYFCCSLRLRLCWNKFRFTPLFSVLLAYFRFSCIYLLLLFFYFGFFFYNTQSCTIHTIQSVYTLNCGAHKSCVCLFCGANKSTWLVIQQTHNRIETFQRTAPEFRWGLLVDPAKGMSFKIRVDIFFFLVRCNLTSILMVCDTDI